jgi:hypothetical protein
MKIELADFEILRPLLAEVARAAVAEYQAAESKLPASRLAFSEPEAAEAMGLARHRLRDARLRGEIKARLVGKSYVYSRSEILRFLDETE